jgi:hypothetical protein
MISFNPLVSAKINGYSILCRQVEGAGRMAPCHNNPHKELDFSAPNEVVNFLHGLMLTHPQSITSYRR